MTAKKTTEVVKKEKDANVNKGKPVHKRWWFWGIIVFLIIAIGSSGTKHDENKTELADTTTRTLDSRLEKFNPQKVHGDTTSKWYVSTIYEDFKIEDLARDYVEKFIKDTSETHFVVNLYLKTTSVIKDYGQLIDVTVHEYTDKEEHYADKIAGGKVLAEYHISKDSGEITKINDES